MRPLYLRIGQSKVGNALLIAVRRKRISRDDMIRFLNDLEALPINTKIMARATIRERVLPLAEQHRLTLYDAAYLAIAIADQLPLATRDLDLLEAARAEGIALLP